MIKTINISLPLWLRLFKFFFVISLLMAVVMSYRLFKDGFMLETDLQSLFPKDQHNQLVEQVNDRFYREFGNKLLIAVQSSSLTEANSAAELLTTAIADNPQLKRNIAGEQIQIIAKQYELLQKYRYQLLTSSQQLIVQNQQKDLLVHAQSALFGFGLDGSVLSPIQDPLNLFPTYIQQLQPAVNGEIVNDRMIISDDNVHLIVFALDLQAESFSLQVQAKMSAWLESLQNQLKNNHKTKDVRVLVSGAVFHAAEASINAQREMTIIGSGSILGVLLLFILAFRRTKALLLSLISVAYGCFLALVINHYFFGKIHLMTLVFGASLIGVAVDYSLHYLCKYQDLSVPIPDWNSRGNRVLEKLLPALSLSLISSVLGYACLLPTPLPGLQQIALFSVVGLCGAWLFLVVTYPFLVRQPLPIPSPIIDYCASFGWLFWERIQGAPRRWIFAVLILMILVGGVNVSFSSDVRTLYKPSSQLLASEQQLQKALQSVSPNQYFLLRAASVEELLQLEESFRHNYLDALVSAGALRSYIATSMIVPSVQQQAINYELQHNKLYASNGLVNQFMLSAGFDAQAVMQAENEFAASAQQYLSVDEWLQVARPDQRLLWLGKLGGNYVSVIALRGVIDVKALSAAANNSSVMWVDRVAGMSQLLQELIHSAAVLLILAYFVILLLLWFFYRRKHALLLIFVPLMATITTLSLLSLSGVAINLFHLFGCYLILGLGMDYAIFSYVEGDKDRVTQRAIWLSAMTSSLSFGLLALSSTPMVSAFGVVLFLGCFFNLLYAPLVGILKK